MRRHGALPFCAVGKRGGLRKKFFIFSNFRQHLARLIRSIVKALEKNPLILFKSRGALRRRSRESGLAVDLIGNTQGFCVPSGPLDEKTHFAFFQVC